MLRSALLATATAATLSLMAAPAFAGPAETAFLARLAGTWTGSGKMTGEETGTAACKMVFRASTGSAKYTGRCNIRDIGAQGFSGSLVYNDARKRYEARAMGGSVAGIKRGNSVVFTTKSDSIAGSAYSTMTVSASRITIDFTIVNRSTNGKTKAHITFSK